MVLNDQILFSVILHSLCVTVQHNRIYNKMIAASQTAQETDVGYLSSSDVDGDISGKQGLLRRRDSRSEKDMECLLLLI